MPMDQEEVPMTFERGDWMVRLQARFLSIIFLTGLFCALMCASLYASEETITKSERDIVLKMCALENPNFDIVLVLDVSGSMGKVLPEFKKMAMEAIDIAQNGDTLVLIRFGADAGKPIISEIMQEHDKAEFRDYVRRTEIVPGYGTDIRRGYSLALKKLKDFNEARKKKGEPVRLALLIFISDGADCPPQQSPFRDPGSAETAELADLITDAQRTGTINLFPMGMEFENYVPKIKALEKEGSTPADEKINEELKKFREKLQNLLSRKNDSEIKDDREKIPKAPWQFYIDWLSNKLELKKLESKPPKNPYRLPVPCELDSGYRKVKVRDILVNARYHGTAGGKVTGKIRLTADPIDPGAASRFTCEVIFPKNWSFSPKAYKGELDVEVNGNMEVNFNEAIPQVLGSPTVTPSPTGKGLIYSYPFVSKKITIPLAGKLPASIELYLLSGGGGIALLLLLMLYIIKKALPMTITLKTETKARAFRLTDGQGLTIGGSSDFELDGCSAPIAAIERQGKSLWLNLKKEGVLADVPQGQPSPQKVELNLGQSINFNIDGTYLTLQILEGDQEDSFTQEQTVDDVKVDMDGDGKGFDF